MPDFTGPAWLDWWANPSTVLGSAAVTVAIDALPSGGWDARARLTADNPDFALLRELDPVFVLRFSDDSEVRVTVHATAADGWFPLTEYTGPLWRDVTHTFTTG